MFLQKLKTIPTLIKTYIKRCWSIIFYGGWYLEVMKGKVITPTWTKAHLKNCILRWNHIIMYFYGNHNGIFFWVNQVLLCKTQMHFLNIVKTKMKKWNLYFNLPNFTIIHPKISNKWTSQCRVHLMSQSKIIVVMNFFLLVELEDMLKTLGDLIKLNAYNT